MAVQPAATLSPIPEFPALSDRAAGTYNSKAYAFGTHMGGPGPFVGEINALAANVQQNASTADAAGATATTQADLALGYRNTANNAAGTATTKRDEAVAAANTASAKRDEAVAAAHSANQDRAYIEALLPALEDGPVLSVNNKSGVVSLAATDVGATPAPHLTPAGIALAGGPMNCQAGDYFTETVNGSRAFAFTNIPTGAYFCSLEILHLSGTFTLPAGSVWSGGTVPTFQTNKRHVLDFQRSQIGSGGWLVTARTGFAP